MFGADKQKNLKITMRNLLLIAALLGIALTGCKKKTEKEVTIVSISVTKQPTKTTYTVGEPFDLSGMVVTATYSDGTSASVTVNSGMITFDSSTTGAKTVTITVEYKGKKVTTTVSVTVNPKINALTVTVATGTYTYNGAEIKPAVTVKAGDATLMATNYTLAYSANTNAGTAIVTATGTGNYAGINGTANFTIAPLTVNVTAANKEKFEGDPDPPLTYTFSPALFGSDVFTGALMRTGAGTPAGEVEGAYDILQGSLALSSNYTINFAKGILTIYFALAGKGTIDEPYEINSPSKLAFLAQQVNANNAAYIDKYYKMTANISLAGYQSGSGWVPIGNGSRAFSGHFDGNNHTISGLLINNASLDYAGLFGWIANGSVKNLGVEGVVTGRGNTGGLVGSIRNSSISNCYVTVAVTGSQYVGGLAGRISLTCSITNCYTTGDIKGENGGAGGLVGYSDTNGFTATNCYATGVIINIAGTGGLVGALNGKIESCVALNPRIVDPTPGRAGRLAGDAGSVTRINNVAWAGMLVNGSTITGGTHDNNNGLNILSSQAQQQATYEGLGWKFGNDDDNPWKMGIGAYPLPVFYWQTSAPKADLGHLE